MSVDLILCAVIFVQQAFYMWQVHKLVNKLMCKSYAEYAQAVAPKPKEIKVTVPGEPVEDLGSLAGFQLS